MSRTPHGVRGLKSALRHTRGHTCGASHPSRGAWIEIIRLPWDVRGGESHPSRGAWIEIVSHSLEAWSSSVAPLTGCVD